jgi:RNA polymerase sigma-70 factor, ECF subfamily
MRDLQANFEAQALPWMDTLYRFAVRLLCSAAEDATDLVQDTYLRAYRSFYQFKDGTDCKSWLFQIMYSIFVNQYRKKQREPETIAFHELEKKLLAAAPEPERFCVHSEYVEGALKELSDEFRTAILLVDVEEFTYEEAAEAMNCPVGTVRSRLFRARKLLYISLGEYAKANGYADKIKMTA